MMYPHYYGGFSGFGLFPIFLILGVILLIWAIAAHRRDRDDMSDNEKLDHGEETALQILKKRYAKGEITKREFLEMKKDIA
ncbi:MAG: SHOCT domain-containing protein [Candidatus Gottesmanbacteria bacterium]|nr:SHOCT domain-containing protein [Candidatus Gottesmanbacteria bacterium]